MELLIELMDALGPSGNEKNVRELILKHLKKHVDEIIHDKFGNLIGVKKGKKDGQKIMLAAHMDEIGLMINSIDSQGKIYFDPLGGIETITLVGQGASILADTKILCDGVISFKELHEDLEITKLPTFEELYVDTGLSKKELETLGVEIGDYVIPRHHSKMMHNKRYISGKALDDRIGCYVMIKLAEMIKDPKDTIYFVFTVQEEIGLYGAKVSAYDLDPDWAIAVETTNSTDSEDGEFILGKGPCLVLKDAEAITNKCLNDYIRELCKKIKVPLQLKVENVGTTDVTNIMISKGGVPSTVLSAPLRNIHTTITIAHVDDINNMIKILEAMIKNPPRICLY